MHHVCAGGEIVNAGAALDDAAAAGAAGGAFGGDRGAVAGGAVSGDGVDGGAFLQAGGGEDRLHVGAVGGLEGRGGHQGVVLLLEAVEGVPVHENRQGVGAL